MLDKIRRIGIIVLIVTLLWAFLSCDKRSSGPEEITVLDSYPAEIVDSTVFNSDEPGEKVIIYKNIWSAADLKLPKGKVVMMDYAHGKNGGNDDQYNNYVVIRDADSIMVIKRDIDVDTYLALSVGDLIR